MHTLTPTLAFSSGLVCLATTSMALSQTAPATTADTGATAISQQAAVEVQAQGQGQGTTPGTFDASTSARAAADQPDAAAGPPGTWEETWVPWNTGEDEANIGIAVFGHLGLGHRFGDGSLGEPFSATGLRVGVTGMFRFNRWIGAGVGYEHADLNRDRFDVEDTSFSEVFRDLNTLWFNARFYPVRIDPFALYFDGGVGPTWQSLDTSNFAIDENNANTSTINVCSGSDSAGLAMRGGVGAELALLSGAILWGELGPDYYILSEDSLDGCAVGAGNAPMFGFRAGIAIGFERTRFQNQVPLPKDADGDRIFDEQDACPTVPGVPDPDPKKNGCPPPKDQDADGIIDELDACPTIAGIANADPTKNGCPPPGDRDGDLVTDDVDACPDLPGIKTEDPKTTGCPGDTDGDGFRDDQDACPQEKGVDDPDPTKRGCPKLVRVTDKEIIILEQVQFDTGKATIKPVSDPLLDSVAQVMKEHPEILKIEVQGHTDDKGSKQLNAKLSQDRADSVRKALESRGIEATRLVSKGYGPDKPIADNKVEDGRAKNRRVQFVVLEKRPPAAAPLTPPPSTTPPATPPAGTPPPATPPATPPPAPAPAPNP